MIKQDYLLRMIQEIISLIASALLNKKKFPKSQWIEYDCLTEQILGMPSGELANISTEELIDRYNGDLNRIEKLELAATTMLKLSDEMESNLLQKSKLRQDGLDILKYVQQNSNSFSIQRVNLINMLEMNA